jgi:hypothetical protein
MPIETLDDIIEEIADRKGVYGVCPDPTGTCSVHKNNLCRCCWTAGLRGRIEAAIEIERKLSTTPSAAPAGKR